MPFNCYAQTSFTEMYGREYFGVCACRNAVHISICPTTGVCGWSVFSLTSSSVSNVLCSIMDQKTSVRKEWVMFVVVQTRPIERLVDSKIETDNERLLSTCQYTIDGHRRMCSCPVLRIRSYSVRSCLHLSADVRKACVHVYICVHTSLVIYYPCNCITTQRKFALKPRLTRD